MSIKKKATNSTSRAIVQYCLLASLYIGLILILPASRRSMQEYMLSPIEYRVLYLAVSIPFLISWLAAFIGYTKLREYAETITGTPEGTSFMQLSRGCAWLAWGLPIQNFITLTLNTIAYSHSGFHSAAIIISNYTGLLLPLIALTIISGASKGLTESARLKFTAAKARGIIWMFVTAALVYCYLTFQRFDLSSFGSTNNPYYLPLWLMVISVMIPYLYAWFVGLLAAYEITLFSRNVQGVLYRQALRILVLGLVAVVVGSIALQYINSASPRLGSLALNYKLLLTSLFRVVGGVGFVLIAVGAIKLKKIEDV
jgi:hypothetical protein